MSTINFYFLILTNLIQLFTSYPIIIKTRKYKPGDGIDFNKIKQHSNCIFSCGVPNENNEKKMFCFVSIWRLTLILLALVLLSVILFKLYSLKRFLSKKNKKE